MEEQRVSFETAKLAKLKGFEDYCDALFTEEGEERDNIGNYNGVDEDEYVHFSRPRQNQLQDWLRVIHKAYIHVTSGNFSENSVLFFFELEGAIYLDVYSPDFRSYEEALEAALVESLKQLD